MPWVRARDVLSVPGLLSLVRLPLAAAFPFVVTEPVAALAILVGSGLSDMLDGWCARRMGIVTQTGAIIDAVMDKLFVATVVITLLISGRMSLGATLWLGTRDVIELPLAVWCSLDREALANRTRHASANAFGKIATVLQYATIAAAVWSARYAGSLAVGAGISGIFAGFTYWARALRNARSSRSGQHARRVSGT